MLLCNHDCLVCIGWIDPLTGCNREHQDYYMFFGDLDPYKPSFATAGGRVPHPRYTLPNSNMEPGFWPFGT